MTDLYLERWIHCQPSPRFIWRDLRPSTANSYRLSPREYYAPMNCYRKKSTLTLRVVLILEAAP